MNRGKSTEHHLVHFCFADGSYFDECYFNDLPPNGMYQWIQENIGEAGEYLCKVYDCMAGERIRDVPVTIP